jgi:NADH:ubiquinone oxidoreductase subunit C
MNDTEGRWIENSYIVILFKSFLSSMYDFYLLKKNIYFFLDIYSYFHLFSFLNSNLILKIDSIIDIIATHYPDNYDNEFELLYVNINYKLNLRFFLKMLINKENLIVSLNKFFKSVA